MESWLVERLIESLPDAIVAMDAEFRVCSWNPAAERIYGWTAPEVIGRDATELFDTRIIDNHREDIRRLLLGGGEWRGEVSQSRKDGSRILLFVSAAAITDASGDAVGFVNVNRETIHAKEGYHALRRSEEKFKAFLDAAPDSMVIIDEAGNIVLVNAQAEATFGYPRLEMLGSPIELLLPVRFRNGLASHRAAYLKNPTMRPMGVGLELAGRRRDGTEFPVDVSLSPLSTEEGVLITAAIRDTSERRRNERTLDFLRRIAVAANRAARVEEALQSCVDEVCSFWGFAVGHAYALSEETGRLTPTDIWHVRGDGLLEDFRRARMDDEGGQSALVLGRVLEAKRPQWFKDLAEVDAKSFTTRKYAAHGLHVGFAFPVMVGTEVTHVLEFYHTETVEPARELLDVLEQVGTQLGRVVERVRAQHQRLYADSLERSNRELRLFAHVASHDLQEPLRMVTSFLELLRERYGDKLDERGTRYVAYAVDGAQRMQALIRSLLEYSRLDSSGTPPAPASVATALQKALENLRQTIRERGAEVTSDPELPTLVTDEPQLVQLFQNLVANAIKFCARPPRVHVSSARTETHFRFTVRDNGIGIDMRYSERVFEIFQRLHTREEYAGTGMGLAICRRIVDRHGGRIWVESDLGTGTRVHFTLADQAEKEPEA